MGRVTDMQCGHTVYYTPAPDPGDTVWCHSCGNYSRVGQPMHTVSGGTIEEWPWTSKVIAGYQVGYCNLCQFSAKEKRYPTLKRRMEGHHLHVHVWKTKGLIIQIEKLPPNAEPPF